MKNILTILLIALTIASCEKDPIEDGTILSIEYFPLEDEVAPVQTQTQSQTQSETVELPFITFEYETINFATGNANIYAVDVMGFVGDTHGTRIIDTFLSNGTDSNVTAIDEIRTYTSNGSTQRGTTSGKGIKYLANVEEQSILFSSSDTDNPEGIEESITALENNKNLLYIASLENTILENDEWGYNTQEYPHGILDTKIMRTGRGLDRSIFVGGLRADDYGNLYASIYTRQFNEFENDAVFILSEDGSSSHSTPNVAAIAADLLNDGYSNEEIKQIILSMSTPTEVSNTIAIEDGVAIYQTLTVNVIH